MKDMNKAYSAPSTNKTTSLNGLKFVSLNINGIRGKKLELLAFLDYHKPDSVAIQETKIDSSISASELFHDSCPYNAYRKDRNLHGDAPYSQGNSHRPWTELENDSESVWAKVFANKTSHYIASWYREPSGSCEDFQLLRNQLEHIKTRHKKLPSVHILGDFNFRDIVWPDLLSKNRTMLSQSEGQVLVDIMNDHGLEQLVNFPTREENTLNLILTSLPG